MHEVHIVAILHFRNVNRYIYKTFLCSTTEFKIIKILLTVMFGVGFPDVLEKRHFHFCL